MFKLYIACIINTIPKIQLVIIECVLNCVYLYMYGEIRPRVQPVPVDNKMVKKNPNPVCKWGMGSRRTIKPL